MRLNMRLGEYLQNHNLTAYKLEKAVTGAVSRNTVYKWAKETQAPDHIHTAQFIEIMQALSRLTGQVVTPNDLLEVVEEPMIDLSQMPPLQSLKPGQVGDQQLKITPARGKFAPKYPSIKTRNGSSVADDIAKQREERDLAVAGRKK
jgi:hypothetical protein